jgi:hypothetical protein
MIEETVNYIRKTLAQAENPSVLVSFGKDSLVLLKLVRQIKPDISIFYFGDRLSRFAESVVKENDLQVYSYAPADRYLVPNGDGYSLIDEYSFGQTRVPLISDLVPSTSCELENLSPTRTPWFDYNADLTLWGYHQGDFHPLVESVFPQRFQLGATVMDAPLYSWSERDVLGAIEELRIPYEPEVNEVQVCDNCLNEINATLDREASLAGFHSRFQFSH